MLWSTPRFLYPNSLTINIAMNLLVWLPPPLSTPCLAPKKLQTPSPPVSPFICPFQLLLLCISDVHSTSHCLKWPWLVNNGLFTAESFTWRTSWNDHNLQITPLYNTHSNVTKNSQQHKRFWASFFTQLAQHEHTVWDNMTLSYRFYKMKRNDLFRCTKHPTRLEEMHGRF